MPARLPTLIVSLCVLSCACGPTPTAPSQFAAYSQTDLQVGTGDEAVSGLAVGVRYTLWLYDSSKPDNKGLQLESTAGADPFTSTVELVLEATPIAAAKADHQGTATMVAANTIDVPIDVSVWVSTTRRSPCRLASPFAC